jgi:hypothetical protein
LNRPVEQANCPKPMDVFSTYIFRALVVLVLMLFFFSCSTYNTQVSSYYSQLLQQDYEKASTAIDHNKKLKQNRNRLLYLLEKGKLLHLMKDYAGSNQYLNEADLFIEDSRTSAKDVAMGTLLNPMMQTYKGESFEKFMVHYYKALNYLYLGLKDEALVEARRISLQNFTLQDKTNNKEKRYNEDAFSLTLQGLIYEHSGDWNNAFIAYRNAADVFLDHNNKYYGVELPEQLKKDVLRTAARSGFMDLVRYYEGVFNTTYTETEIGEGGELVLFWENGLAPVKTEQNYFFTLTKDGDGNFFFVDPTGSLSIPFDFSSGATKNDLEASSIRTFRIAFPRYEEQLPVYTNALLRVDTLNYSFQAVQSINSLAYATLKERFLKEMAGAVSRLAVKKIAEAAMRPKNDSAKHAGARNAAAFALQMFSLASEKADTRNWQSLPHTISYVRIPLKKGPNQVEVELSTTHGSVKKVGLSIEGTGQVQLQNLCTFQ